MKVPHTRYNLLTLAATMLVATLLVPVDLGAQGSCGASQRCGGAASGSLCTFRRGAAPVGGALARDFVASAHLPHFCGRPCDRGRAGGKSNPNPD